MFANIGPAGFILILVVALLLFGPNKLPELGRAAGRTLREFKESFNTNPSSTNTSSEAIEDKKEEQMPKLLKKE